MPTIGTAGSNDPLISEQINKKCPDSLITVARLMFISTLLLLPSAKSYKKRLWWKSKMMSLYGGLKKYVKLKSIFKFKPD